MKTFSAIVASLSLLVVLGCGNSPKGGASAGEFSIVTPMLGVTLKQGETKTVKVTFTRSNQFKRDIALDTRISGEGVQAVASDTVLSASDAPEVDLQVSASPDAALGEHKLYIKGTPQNGDSKSGEMTVRVVAP